MGYVAKRRDRGQRPEMTPERRESARRRMLTIAEENEEARGGADPQARPPDLQLFSFAPAGS